MPQELDKDLTMLDGGEPTPTDSALDEILKNSTEVGYIGPAPTTQKQYDEAVMNEQARNQFLGSLQEGAVDPELDAGRSMFEDTNAVRARNQSSWVKGIKAGKTILPA